MIDVKVAFADSSHISVKDIVTIIQAVVTIIAVILGGVWTYFLFIKKRQRFPRASISHQIFYKRISESKALLNIKTVIANSGDVLLCLESGFVRIQQILPIPDDIADIIKQDQDPVGEDKTEVDWPLISERFFTWDTGKCEIEPAESDQFVSDHVIDPQVQLISVYSYFKNTKKRKRDIGWGATTVYRITPDSGQSDQVEGGLSMSAEKKDPSTIVRQQPPKPLKPDSQQPAKISPKKPPKR